LVVARKRLPVKHPIYFDVGDKRMIFIIPKATMVYIGTTDTDYSDNLDNPQIQIKDINYLIEAVNRVMPVVKLRSEDIVTCWAGLRPLIHKPGKKPSELSRKDEIFVSKTGLISIAGGKLTGYRLMSKRVVNKVVDLLRQTDNISYRFMDKCKTKHIPLSGGNFPFPPELYFLIDYADQKFDEAKQTGISVEDFITLFYRYGMNIDYLTEKAFEFYSNNKDTKQAWLKAELWYAVNYEMVTNVCDFLLRRTGMMLFEPQEAKQLMNEVANELCLLLNCTEEQKQQYKDEFVREAKIRNPTEAIL